jgi:hypothetical protein
MASSYSTDLKLELMVTGENAGTWGDKTNSNLNLIQQAIAGYETINVGASDVTLVMSNATLSNARNMILNLSGSLTGARQVLVPDGIEKFYIVRDQTTRNGNSLTIKTVSGSGFAIETSGQLVACYSDGTNVVEISLNTLTGTIATAQIDNLAITEAKLASFAVTSARVASFAVTANKLATNAVTAIKIAQSTITQSKLAANSVGSNQLISTGVTASTYTSATITVDADGRITSASSGSAGAGGFVPTLTAQGPASGTYTATPSANRLAVYMFAGGGGGGGYQSQNFGPQGGQGGFGGFGFYNKPITQPFSQPYSVGAQGNAGGPSGGGNTGGNTVFTNVGTVNGGSGGGFPASQQTRASPGTAPGASYVFTNREMLGAPAGTGSEFNTSPRQTNTITRGTSDGGNGGQSGMETENTQSGNNGGAGFLMVFENTGT